MLRFFLMVGLCAPLMLACDGDTSGSDGGSDDAGTGGDGGSSGDGAVGMDGSSGDGGGSSDGGSAGTCGDSVLDVAAGELCDDGNTTNGDGCDDRCLFEPVGATCGDSTIDALEKCDPPEVMPADGSGCNATCNLSGLVTTLTTVGADAITSDNTSLYLAIHDCAADECGIARIDIAACNAAPGTAACTPTYLSGGPGQCACSTGTCPWGGSPPLTPAPAVIDGDSATATFDGMGTMTTDGTTIWVGHQQVLRAVDVATGAVTTVAGTIGSCAAIDGNGTSALLHGIRGLTYWGGRVYFLDGTEAVLRSFDPSTGDVTTIAGARRPDCQVTQSPPYSCRAPCDITSCGGPTAPSPGMGTSAVFVSPRYMTADGVGNLYIIDTNGEAILRYDTTTTQMDVLASGSVSLPAAYTDGTGSAITIGRPRGIISDGTSIYFAEQDYATIRQVELSTVTSTTFVGSHGCVAAAGTTGRDGLGANTSGARNCGSAPTGTPIFHSLFGAMTFNYASRSIYALDEGQLRRIE